MDLSRPAGLAVLALLVCGGIPAARAEEPMSTPVVRDLDTHHLPTPPADLASWEKRADALRNRILFSAGLLPMPARNPLRPMVTGTHVYDDYIVDNVAIETFPGFRLCGNLYRPRWQSGPFPAIVNPHGHWSNGRLEMQPDVPLAAAAPGPRGEGKGNLVAIGVDLARQGFVVFAYDMVGYNDTTQASHQMANTLQPWLWNVSLNGLQLWNSIRVVDYLSSRKDVDHRRIGVTGASGGGTQTFLLAAVDNRVAVSVPVNMVSASMQGGCLCENGPGLRLDTDNVEIAALTAPRPQLLVACTGDWTARTPTEEFPTLQRYYGLYNAGTRTEYRQFNYGHNYNVESRVAMVGFFCRYLKDEGPSGHYPERPFTLVAADSRVWTDKAPRREGFKTEPEVVEALMGRAEAMSGMTGDSARLKAARQAMVAALALEERVASFPRMGRRGGSATLIVTDAAGREAADRQAAAVRATGADARVVETSAPESLDALWTRFYTCYNRTALQRDAAAIALAASKMAADHSRVDIVGTGAAGVTALLARSVLPISGRLAVDVSGFDPTDDHAYMQRLFAPGLRYAGDVRSALALLSGTAVRMAGAGPDWTDAISIGRACGTSVSAGDAPAALPALVAWARGR